MMPFGLVNAPTTFRHLMRVVLNGTEWDGVLAYLDDIIVYARTFDEHLRNLDLVLSRLELHGCCSCSPKVSLLSGSNVFAAN